MVQAMRIVDVAVYSRLKVFSESRPNSSPHTATTTANFQRWRLKKRRISEKEMYNSMKEALLFQVLSVLSGGSRPRQSGLFRPRLSR